MIEWGTILYGAALSGVAAVLGLLLVRQRDKAVLVAGGLSAFAAPIGWNAILRATHSEEFFTDLPVAVFPASWQDFGSGVFTFALASLSCGVLFPRRSGREVVLVASVCGLAAFLVDIYLY